MRPRRFILRAPSSSSFVTRANEGALLRMKTKKRHEGRCGVGDLKLQVIKSAECPPIFPRRS
ncbi:MAG TPA: hypothetical protein DDZ68_15330 [Parvularcula sp.]|nr:hypothetical protein [Parvularcula sp.]HBS33359.1 hypothetical protein [Parvularcula sp.]HBS35164.1 hypothetical protein [Parvularcula sp.]